MSSATWSLSTHLHSRRAGFQPERTGVGFSKVPQVVFSFWVIKIIATTLGETGGNAVTLTLGFGYLLGTLLFTAFLVVAVAAQIKAKRFHSILYWTVITATTLAGTALADLFDRSMGMGYLGGSLSLFTLVLASLGLWYWSEGTVAVETVATPKVECFYWLTIMFSQTLGTALGDWMADSTPLGYNGSALLIGFALVIMAALHFFTNVSRTALFWAAFILTRPLGATLANSLDKPAIQGGLGFNDLTISAALVVMMVICLILIPQHAGVHPSGEPGPGRSEN